LRASAATLTEALFGEGEYTLEVLRSKLSRVKLTERDPDAAAGQERDRGMEQDSESAALTSADLTQDLAGDASV